MCSVAPNATIGHKAGTFGSIPVHPYRMWPLHENLETHQCQRQPPQTFPVCCRQLMVNKELVRGSAGHPKAMHRLPRFQLSTDLTSSVYQLLRCQTLHHPKKQLSKKKKVFFFFFFNGTGNVLRYIPGQLSCRDVKRQRPDW